MSIATKVEKAPSGKWMLDRGGNYMSTACHHQRNGACGGCYARAMEALSELAEAGHADAVAVIEAAKAESAQ